MKSRAFNQILFFETWFNDNRDKFTCKPIVLKKTENHLLLKYENIIGNIVISVSGYGTIDIRLENMVGLECVDLLADF